MLGKESNDGYSHRLPVAVGDSTVELDMGTGQVARRCLDTGLLACCCWGQNIGSEDSDTCRLV